MAYTPQNWNLEKPITPEALNYMEKGIEDNSKNFDNYLPLEKSIKIGSVSGNTNGGGAFNMRESTDKIIILNAWYTDGHNGYILPYYSYNHWWFKCSDYDNQTINSELVSIQYTYIEVS